MSEILAKFTVPLKIRKTKTKWFYLNLNNLIQVSRCFPLRNKLKQDYSRALKPMLESIPRVDCAIKVIYVVHARDRRVFDTSNVGAVVDKFVADSMTAAGIIKDDNYNIIPRVEYIFGGLDIENPTCDVYLIRDDLEEYKQYLRTMTN